MDPLQKDSAMGIIAKPIAILFLGVLCLQRALAYEAIKIGDTSIRHRYDQSLEIVSNLIEENGPFKLAVYEVENTFSQGKWDRIQFENSIGRLVRLCQSLVNSKKASNFLNADSLNYLLNYSIFSTLHDTVYLLSDSFFLGHKPYSYNYTDPNGRIDWSNMFVTRLLTTHKGNCHSLSYLYKILADDLGAKCWLALAPNHIYIRNYSDWIGWYNTELTSGVFPTDAWISMTGYVSTDAIRSGVYMDTLSNQQSIALCALDLAKEYEMQTHNYYDGFILKCCSLVLQYHSVDPQALLLKAETLQKIYLKQKRGHKPDAGITYEAMEKSYIALAKLGYREMPEQMYIRWLRSAVKEKEKFTNKKVTHVHGS